MITVGLCGGSGSGKGTLCRILAEHGIPAFDCDAVYHEMISADGAVTKELIEAFGESVRLAGGGIDRTRLSTIVFSPERPDALCTLNEITHRHVRDACLAWLDEQRARGAFAAIVDAPLLFESGFDSLCDLTVAVVAPAELRIERIMARDEIERSAAERRLAVQISDDELICRADTVIENARDEAALRLDVTALINKIKEIEK